LPRFRGYGLVLFVFLGQEIWERQEIGVAGFTSEGCVNARPSDRVDAIAEIGFSAIARIQIFECFKD
jgi:hypothetical protein